MTLEEATWQEGTAGLCFRGTTVPVSSLFDYLVDGKWEDFFGDFPDVSHEQVGAVIARSGRLFQSAHQVGPTPDLDKRRFRRLTKAVDEILYYVWDPIGVMDSPEARDEYLSYVPYVVREATSGASPKSLAEYLDSLSKEHMTVNSERSLLAAELVLRHLEIDW